MSARYDDGFAATRAVYVISVAAELAGVHPQTLRIYERKGLLDPARTIGGTRRYSDSDIARLRKIQELTNSGVNLEGVRRILALERQLEKLAGDLQQAEECGRAPRSTRRTASTAATWSRCAPSACRPAGDRDGPATHGRDPTPITLPKEPTLTWHLTRTAGH